MAVAQTLPGVPHQTCQSHGLREAGKLTFAADRALKKRLKATLRSVLACLHRRIQALPSTALFRPILLDYTEALRSKLLVDGVAPFDLGGVAVCEALESLEASLVRCQKKGITHYCAAW